MKKSGMMRLVRVHRRLLLAGLHGLLIVVAMVLAFLLRFEYSLPREAAPLLSMAVWLAVVVKLPVFVLRRHDRGGWQYAGLVDLRRLLGTNVLASAALAGVAVWGLGGGFRA